MKTPDVHPALGIDKVAIVRTRCAYEAELWIDAALEALNAAKAATKAEDWAAAAATAARAVETVGQAEQLLGPLAPGHVGGISTAEYRLARSPAKRNELRVGN